MGGARVNILYNYTHGLYLAVNTLHVYCYTLWVGIMGNMNITINHGYLLVVGELADICGRTSSQGGRILCLVVCKFNMVNNMKGFIGFRMKDYRKDYMKGWFQGYGFKLMNIASRIT